MDADKRTRNNGKDSLSGRFRRRLRLVYLKMLRIDDPPERIARGAAIGILMGILPTFGAGTFLSLGFAFAFRANKAAAVLASLVVNPLTSPFFWTLSAIVGGFILREDYGAILDKLRNGSVWHGVESAYMVYMTGNIIVSAAFTAAAYYIVKYSIIKHRERKARRLNRTV